MSKKHEAAIRLDALGAQIGSGPVGHWLGQLPAAGWIE
jgi:hypothetical protein